MISTFILVKQYLVIKIYIPHLMQTTVCGILPSNRTSQANSFPSAQKEFEDELLALPVRQCDTLKYKQRKMELEGKLTEIDEAIKECVANQIIFCLPHMQSQIAYLLKPYKMTETSVSTLIFITQIRYFLKRKYLFVVPNRTNMTKMTVMGHLL